MDWELSEYWEVQPSLMCQQQSQSREVHLGIAAQFDISEFYQKISN